jgi:hypothetical protein
MTTVVDGRERCRRQADALVVVHVTDAVNPVLAGHGDAAYHSPPQPREAALNLVRLLLGRRDEPSPDESRWTCPIAGGRRTVTLHPATLGASRADDA